MLLFIQWAVWSVFLQLQKWYHPIIFMIGGRITNFAERTSTLLRYGAQQEQLIRQHGQRKNHPRENWPLVFFVLLIPFLVAVSDKYT